MRVRNAFALLAAVSLLGAAACETEDDGVPADGPAVTPEQPAQPADPADPGVDPSTLPAGVTVEMVSQGREIFTGQGFCYTCHGQEARGGPLGPDLTDEEWLNIQSRDFEQLVGVVQSGVAEPVQFQSPMPPMGGAQLSQDQIRAVAAYVYSLGSGGAGR